MKTPEIVPLETTITRADRKAWLVEFPLPAFKSITLTSNLISLSENDALVDLFRSFYPDRKPPAYIQMYRRGLIPSVVEKVKPAWVDRRYVACFITYTAAAYDGTFYELQINDELSKFHLMGRYYGYPECCIDQFITENRKRLKWSMDEREVHNESRRKAMEAGGFTLKSGYIPCATCLTIGGTKVEATIQGQRVSPEAFPTDHDALAMLRAVDAYLKHQL